MAPQDYKVDDADVSFASTAAHQSADTLLGTKNSMMSGLAPLAKWTGAGGTSYESVRGQVDVEFGKLTMALTSIGEDLGTAGVKYAAADEAAQAAVNKVGAEGLGSITTSLKA